MNSIPNGGGTVKKPNVLIIYADQMRADAMGCAGNPCIKTPYFDRLAQEGVRFTNAYTSFPLCTPFRGSLFTGKYNHATGVHANHHPIPLGQDFLAEIFKDNGYQTGYIGKWHLDGGDKPGYVPPGPRRLGFDQLIGFNRGHFYLQSIYYRDTDQPYHCRRYEPDFQTDHLIEFMESCLENETDKPFLGMICYGPPHFPFNMPEYLKNLYNPDDVPLTPSTANPEQQREVRKRLQEGNFPLTSGVWGEDESPSGGFETEKEVREFLSLYYGMITHIDHNVGIILNWLDRKQIADDTIIILLSDHGDMAGENGHACRTKKTPHRGATHVPLLIRFPKRFPKAHLVNSLVDVGVDTMPTLLDVCGIPVPEAVQGVSYAALLEGNTAPTRDAVFYEVCMEKEGPERFPIPERAVRTPEWLYCRTQKAPLLLFDLENDPYEMNNLIHDERYGEKRGKLDRMLAEHMHRTGDDWAIAAKFPPPGFLTHEVADEKIRNIMKKAIIEP